MPSDDVREFLEFNGTAVGRLGERLGDIEQALARGELGTALHLLRQAKTTQVVIAKDFDRATSSLVPQRSEERGEGGVSRPELRP